VIIDWVGPLILCRDEVMRVPLGIPGVYLLQTEALQYAGYPVFYVGKANDLRRRLLQHLGHHTAKPAVRAMRELERGFFSAAPVLDASLMSGVESGLIRLLEPICNDQIPSAKPILVNLPPLTIN
jgi:hypothetical protein